MKFPIYTLALPLGTTAVLCWLVLFCLSPPLLFAQAQHEKWFFGHNAGLDFSGGNPVAVGGSVMQTDEGCTSIADDQGQLLFYTDGVRVFDRSHQVMPNGNGLWGGSSSSQSALIVPMVGEDSMYYVFTVAAQLMGGHSGLAYSVVDMRLRGGLGDVSLLNVALVDSTGEKLTATRHPNGKDVWVVCHKWNSDAFYAYLVTCGAVEEPVISRAGLVHAADSVMSGSAVGIGCMKISPDGRKLALAWSRYRNTFSADADSWAEYFDFDARTGVVSNGRVLEINMLRSYGVAFSPSGRYLYVSVHGLLGGIGYNDVRQYDLQAADVNASRVIVGSGNPAFGTLQLAPNGQLYASRLSFVNYLSAFVFPDSGGTGCMYDPFAVQLDSGRSTWGLPNHWDRIVEPELFGFQDTTHCREVPLVLDPGVTGATGWQWSNGATTSSVVVNASGWWTVSVFRPCDTLVDSVLVNLIRCDSLIEIFVAEDTSGCAGDEMVLDATFPGALSYAWNTGASTPSIVVVDSGLYWVDVQLSDTLVRDSIWFRFRECECVFLPNVFSPNADGINDVFLPRVDCAPEAYLLEVYDRWGKQVFWTKNPMEGWDGQMGGAGCPDGVYYWVAHWAQVVGQPGRMVGNVVLMR